MPRIHLSPLLAALGLAGALCTPSLAADPAPRDFGFRPLEIYPFKEGTGDLRLADFNRDGRQDIVFINNRASRLELLIRKENAGTNGVALPRLDERFEDRGFVIDQALRHIRAGDVDGDGHPDLIAAGAALGIQIRLNNGDGSFSAPRRIIVDKPAQSTDLAVRDLDGDGAVDLILARQDGAEILWNDRGGHFPERTPMTFAEAGGLGLEIADFDEDNRPDLLFVFSDAELPLRLRFNEGRRSFGVEHPLHLPPFRDVGIVEHEGRPLIGCVFQNGLLIRLYHPARHDHDESRGLRQVVPLRLPLEGVGSRDSVAWATGEFGDGPWPDFVAAAPRIGQVHIYPGRRDGLRARPRRLNSLVGIDSLCVDPAGNIAVLSRKEKAVAVHRRDALDTFPAILDLPGDPVALASGFEAGSLKVLSRDDDGALSLLSVRADAGNPVLHSVALELKNEPEHMTAVRLGGDAWGVLLFIPYREPQMIIVRGEETESLPPSAFRALADQVPPAAFAFPDWPSGERVVVAGRSVARRYRWTGDGFEVTRQYNPERSEARLAGACPLPSSAHDSRTALYDQSSSELLITGGDGEAMQRIRIRGGVGDLTGMADLRPTPTNALTLALVNRHQVLLTRPDSAGLETRVAAEYSSTFEDPALRYLRCLRVGERRTPVIGVVDQENRAVELVGFEGKDLRHRLSIEVFHAPALAQQKKSSGIEPHDLRSGDVTGDGIDDFVLLVHDRLILYPGE